MSQEKEPINKANAWSTLGPLVMPRLSSEDDPVAWEAMVNSIYSNAELLLRGVDRADRVLTELGRCSNWLRPHQTRWTAGGGFAWPSGYLGSGYSRQGLPKFDWSVKAQWDADDQLWRPAPERLPEHNRDLWFRVAAPSRTTPRCPRSAWWR